MEIKRTSTTVKINKAYLHKIENNVLSKKALLTSILERNISKYKDTSLDEILKYELKEAVKIQVAYNSAIAALLDEIAPLIKVRSAKASYIINKELERL